MNENNDENVLILAREIQSERGGSLTDAMILAEERLQPVREIPTSFTVQLDVKPRVARWILDEFKPTDRHTTEDRLAAYLQIILNRTRVTARRAAEEGPDIGEGGAVTLRRDVFQRKAPKG